MQSLVSVSGRYKMFVSTVLIHRGSRARPHAAAQEKENRPFLFLLKDGTELDQLWLMKSIIMVWLICLHNSNFI